MKNARSPKSVSRQRGVVLLFSLIALVVLLIAAVALMRSFNSSLFLSGNIAFKRDLQNQGERATEKAMAAFRTTGVGALRTAAARAANVPASNYSASLLPTNAQGIPLALQSDADFALVGVATNDITPANEPSLADQAVTVRYVIDRMCSVAGNETGLGAGVCLLSDNDVPAGGSASNLQGPERSGLGAGVRPAIPQSVVYRLTVRVRGPRDTQAFFQSTFSVPS